MKPKPQFCVAQVWMSGVKTVQTFHDETEAWQHAVICGNTYRGNLVYLGKLVAQSSEPMEDEDVGDN